MKILGSLLFLFSFIFAQEFKAYLEREVITQGEPARLYLEASGDEILIPSIERIGEFPVAHTTQSDSIIQRGNSFERRKTVILTFYPTKDVVIPPFSVKIDGKEFKSEPLRLKVKKAKKSDNIHFTLTLDKKEAYVGEPIKAELVLKIKRSVNIVDYNFNPPKFENFWVKELKSSNRYLEEHGEFLIKRITFLLFPQKAGHLKISPAIFKYAIPSKMTDMFGFSVTAPKWHTLLTQEESVIVKPLPKEVDMVGDFNLTLTAQKKEITPNEPLNVTLTITGEGNLENLDKIDLNISNATVYADKPKLQEEFIDGKLKSTFIQKFSIISSKSFTIPPIELEYFSLQEKKIKKLKSEPISIEVLGATSSVATTKTVTPQAVSTPSKQQNPNFWIGFLSGIGVTLLAFGIGFLFRKKPTFKGKRKDKRVLLNQLLPHLSKDPKVASLAQALYEELYEGKKRRVKKKEIEKVLKEIK